MKNSKNDTISQIPRSQWFIKVMQQLGYQSSDMVRGMCYGVAHMGMQAVLARDVKTFDERLVKISKSVVALSFKKIILFKALFKFKNFFEDILIKFKLIQSSENQLENRELQKYNYILNAIKIQQPEFNESIENDHDVRAFFDGAMLYQRFPGDIDVVLSHDASEYQSSKRALEISHIIKPIDFKNTCITPIANVIGVYHKRELTTYFNELAKIINEANHQGPVVLILTADEHGIMVAYDNGGWIFIDANKLSLRYIAKHEEIAKEVFLSFRGMRYTIYSRIDDIIQINLNIMPVTQMTARIYTNVYDQELANKLNAFQQLQLHKPTDEKIKDKQKFFKNLFYEDVNVEYIKLLLLDCDIKNIEELITTTIREEKIEVLKLLLDHPKVQSIDVSINLAIVEEKTEALKLLLDHPKVRKSIDDCISTAIYREKTEALKFLLNYQGIKNIDGHISTATYNDKIEVLKLLLNYPDIKNIDNHISMAIYRETTEALKLLLDHGSVVKIAEWHIHNAISKKNIRILQLLLTHEKCISITDRHIEPLIRDLNIDILEALLPYEKMHITTESISFARNYLRIEALNVLLKYQEKNLFSRQLVLFSEIRADEQKCFSEIETIAVASKKSIFNLTG